MRLEDLAPAKGAKHSKKRVGRGTGSGLGKTAGRGSKGQKSRSGGGTPPWFEGGQMPLQRRVPKRGFTNIFAARFSILNVKDLQRFEPAGTVDIPDLIRAGYLKKGSAGIKLLGEGDISFSIHVRVHKASPSAISKVEAAGGRVELISLPKRT
ncbi:MAG TPA: 50S ribosomal protein L15 [Syntrophobacteraceae bacterium]|nr:50S ribosomal protein L15 [Syntrophobacteraceae bacterium]